MIMNFDLIYIHSFIHTVVHRVYDLWIKKSCYLSYSKTVWSEPCSCTQWTERFLSPSRVMPPALLSSRWRATPRSPPCSALLCEDRREEKYDIQHSYPDHCVRQSWWNSVIWRHLCLSLFFASSCISLKWELHPLGISRFQRKLLMFSSLQKLRMTFLSPCRYN